MWLEPASVRVGSQRQTASNVNVISFNFVCSSVTQFLNKIVIILIICNKVLPFDTLSCSFQNKLSQGSVLHIDRRSTKMNFFEESACESFATPSMRR